MLKLTVPFIVAFAAILMTSNSASAQLKKTKEELTHVEGLTKESVLLVAKHTSGMYMNLYNKRKQKDLDENYKGKYEVVDFSTVENDPKYSDLNIYRFMLKDTANVNTFIKDDGRRSTSSTIHYVLYDRVTKQIILMNIYGFNPDRLFRRALIKVNSLIPTT